MAHQQRVRARTCRYYRHVGGAEFNGELVGVAEQPGVGLVAVGSASDPTDPTLDFPAQLPAAWVSVDGREWRRHDIAAEVRLRGVTTTSRGLVAHGVTILGPTNLVSRKPYHASQMFSKNVETFLKSLLAEGELKIDTGDEVTAGTLLCRDGEVVHPRLRELLGLAALTPAAPAPAPEGE